MRYPPKVETTCPGCDARFLVPAHQLRNGRRKFCSGSCYYKQHATTPILCQTCGRPFVSKGYNKRTKHCSAECWPRSGENNPNFGKRHPGLFQWSAAYRLRMSEERMGAGNPRWSGGSQTNQKFQHQSFVRTWAMTNLEPHCAVCGSSVVDIHHIVPRRYFQPVRLAHFAQNLMLLCVAHNRPLGTVIQRAMKARKLQEIPYIDRLPQSILSALERDGLVSTPMPECDYSPLGNVGESLAQPDTGADTDA